MNGIAARPIVPVEVLQQPNSLQSAQDIEGFVLEYIQHLGRIYNDIVVFDFHSFKWRDHIKSICVCDVDSLSLDGKGIVLSECELKFHIYRVNSEGPASESISAGGDEVSAASHWILPAQEFEGLWENLLYDTGIKNQLLNYVSTALLFSDCGINSNIISCNKVILLHGPPGTGKTSLCKALAQKLSIRLADRYKYGQLIEINSHSLFSKWFSESGKLVMKLFESIQELIDDPTSLVILLIDEVESLAHTRKLNVSSNEPSDSLRVVNALLTQIDTIKRYPNVLILTTSNVSGAIDLAFVDRADIKQFIGPPCWKAIFKIFSSCLEELMRKNIISPSVTIFPLPTIDAAVVSMSDTSLSLKLVDIAKMSEGLSGRTLRKLPFLAHAIYLKKPIVNLETFLDALSKAVIKQFEERQEIQDS